MTLLRRLGAAGVGLFTGIAVALLVGDGNYGTPAPGSCSRSSPYGLRARSRAGSPPGSFSSWRRPERPLCDCCQRSTTARSRGRGGFVTGDDRQLRRLLGTLVQLLRGSPIDQGGSCISWAHSCTRDGDLRGRREERRWVLPLKQLSVPVGRADRRAGRRLFDANGRGSWPAR